MFRDTANSLHRSSNPVSIRTRRTVIGRPPRIADNHCQPTRVVADQRDETLRVPLTYRITVSISNYTPSWIDTGGEEEKKNSPDLSFSLPPSRKDPPPPSRPCALAWNLLSFNCLLLSTFDWIPPRFVINIVLIFLSNYLKILGRNLW